MEFRCKVYPACCRMQVTLHAARRTLFGASRFLVQATPARSIETRRVPSRHCRGARVYGYLVIRLRPCVISSTLRPPRGFCCVRLRPLGLGLDTGTHDMASHTVYLLHYSYSTSLSAVSQFCDHRACIAQLIGSKNKHRHGLYWVCWMSTGRNDHSM